MAYLAPYKKITAFIQNESYEPLVSWGVRMALSGTVPVIWGLATNRINDAIWIALTAEGISWVEMKGSFNWRVRTLFIGALLAMAWGAIGTLTGHSLLLSVVFMFVAAFKATLLRNLGDRASGLAICVYLMFIICNAYPERDLHEVRHRLSLIAIGACWPIVVGLSASLIMPVEQPFRRQIAIIWRAIASLADTISHYSGDRAYHDEVYQKEKLVREAIDKSFEFYGRMAHQANRKDNTQYQLLQLRKNAALVSVNLISIAVELEYISTADIHPTLRVKAATLFSALREAVSRMSALVLTLKSEEKLLAATQVKRIKKLTALIKNFPLPEGERQTEAIQKIVMLTGRTTKLLESAISRVEQLGNDVPVYRSYSMIKTMFVLQPKKIASNVRTLFNFNSLAIRFAFRSAITAAIALFVGVFFKIDHGYWLPFSLMIVIQPYFGATLKKAIDRITGTILGGIAGGLLVLVPTDLHIKEALLFITFVVMVYYVRKNYAIAAFAVTLNLVLLFNIDQTFSYQLLLIRALSTVGGSLLAVAAGFALLPNWDKKWLPRHLAEAVYANYTYFTGTFYSTINNWIKNKRRVESANSNVFDSFNRYMEEPGSSKSDVFYDVITCNIRVTRDLNNINLEQEEKSNVESSPAQEQLALVAQCNQLFLDIISVMRQINTHVPPPQPAELQTGVFQFRLNHFQLISLQKLRLELQHMREDIAHLAEVSIENEAAG